MKSFHNFPSSAKQQIRYILTDIDDTLTNDGILPAVTYRSIERLQQTGIKVIPITGRPAGWCDHIARMWPVDGLVGENGAFYFCYDRAKHKMIRRFWHTDDQRHDNRLKLAKLKEVILEKVPGCAVSADQHYRETDLAIDFCEDVSPPLSQEAINTIVSIFQEAGATAKISSIHVNGWFGDYDKLSMTKHLFHDIFQAELDSIKNSIIFTGDSPNDAPMFSYFHHGVGVANIKQFLDILTDKPAWITKQEGGYGFAEMADVLLT